MPNPACGHELFMVFQPFFSFHLRRFSVEKKKSNVIPVNEALVTAGGLCADSFSGTTLQPNQPTISGFGAGRGRKGARATLI
jgi:hypothetical protein